MGDYMSVTAIRQDFPGLLRLHHGKPLAFLDTAASAQKPQCMLEALLEAYAYSYANIHRGMYHLSELATSNFEAVRDKVARFINAAHRHEIIFTKNATEGFNLLAHHYAYHLRPGDEVVVTVMEHHANFVPWWQACQLSGATFKVAPLNAERNNLDVEALLGLLTERTKVLAITAMSNVLGVTPPLKPLITAAHAVGAVVVVDACQSIAHLPLDVQQLDCDFLAFSAHKLYGPNGVGVLYGKENLLQTLIPYQLGGEMVNTVSIDNVTYQDPPFRFEAGTPAIAEVIAFGAVLDYLSTLDWPQLIAHEQQLLNYAETAITQLKNFTIVNSFPHKTGIISLRHQSASPFDIGAILDQCGVAVRAGNSCAQPLMHALQVTSLARISLGIYTNYQDIDLLVQGLNKVNTLFKL